MADDWEDWESENFNIPDLKPQNEEQIKRLEERRLVEESDNKIARQLFGYEDEDEEESQDLSLQNKSQIINHDKILKPIRNKKSTVNNQKENEQKMKEKSEKIKEIKKKKQNEKDLFGEADEDEYAYYEEKFY